MVIVRCMSFLYRFCQWTFFSSPLVLDDITSFLSMPRPTCSNDRTWGPKWIISFSFVDKYTTDTLFPDIFCIRAVWNCKHLKVWTTMHIFPAEYCSPFSVDESSYVALLSLLAVLSVPTPLYYFPPNNVVCSSLL